MTSVNRTFKWLSHHDALLLAGVVFMIIGFTVHHADTTTYAEFNSGSGIGPLFMIFGGFFFAIWAFTRFCEWRESASHTQP